ncbi:MAG: protein kinase [Candidatus Obscuribacterales bacterium]|nr:protein kinase [Candidatus Obscuribacterales bacterium]
MQLPANTLIEERYEIISCLGEGGMGQVYLATEISLRRKVALKFLHNWLAADSDSQNRFYREAEILSRLEHPNIDSA